MNRSFVFSQGKLVSQDLTPDVLRLVLYDEAVQIWVDIEQPTEEETKTLLEGVFNFHPLAIEDCVAISERPKADDYEQYIFMVIHAVDYSAHVFCTTELNMFIGKNFLVTYHRDPLRSVNATCDRVLKNPAAVARAPDRLTYTLLGLLLDNYQPALDQLSVDIGELEQRVLTAIAPDVLSQVMQLKRETQHLKQIVSPQRDVLAQIGRGEFKIVRAHMLPYYRDLLDRLVRINELADRYRDSLTGVMQVYLALQQNQLNHVIKILTILATLSLPILAITSYYGMNIKHFPPMDWAWPHAYLWVFGVTGILTLLIYWYLKRRRWM